MFRDEYVLRSTVFLNMEAQRTQSLQRFLEFYAVRFYSAWNLK